MEWRHQWPYIAGETDFWSIKLTKKQADKAANSPQEKSECRVGTMYYLKCLTFNKKFRDMQRNKVQTVLKEKSCQQKLSISICWIQQTKHQSSYYKYVQRTKGNHV